jgi:FlaA1/EpsC-like NDP-sugar epimerase
VVYLEGWDASFMQKMFNDLLGMSRSKKMAIGLLTDSLMVFGVFAAAMWLRLGNLAFLSVPNVWLAVVPALPVALILLHTLGFYRAVIRYITARALKSVILATACSGFAMAAGILVLRLPVPATVPVIYTLLLFVAVGASRYVFREVIHSTLSRGKERVVIYGSGAAGRQVAHSLMQGTDYLPIAFVDDEPSLQGSLVAGLRVYSPDKIDHLIRNNSVASVLLAIPSASRERRSEVLKWLEQFPLHLRTIPGHRDIVSGRARIDEINDISIEDLLGRDPVPPRDDLLGANIHGKTVMVTGAGGSIGSELCRQILIQRPDRLVLFEQSEIALYSIEQEATLLKKHEHLTVEIVPIMGSVQNRALMERTLRRFKVNTVYHAAAYKHVPLVEHNVAEGIRNNVMGTRAAVEASVAAGVEAFMLISTDKAVRPTSIMGASKRLAELVCQAYSAAPHCGRTTISMVRFGNVLGSSGSVIPLFRRQIAAGGPITVTHPEITRFFMTIPEAAQLVIQAGAMARKGDVFVLDMGEPVRIAELAAQMARLHGLIPVLQARDAPVGPGEVGIVFTRLRPGEKLYEELLIGNDPQATVHPRILTATESHLAMPVLMQLLDQMEKACEASDIDAIHRILIDAQTAYQPQRDVVDYFAGEDDEDFARQAEQRSAEGKRLTLVRG